MANRPQQGPRPNNNTQTAGGVSLRKTTPEAPKALTYEAPAVQPFTPDPSLFQPETEADRRAEAQAALHGLRVETSNVIYLTIFNALEGVQSALRKDERAKISFALARRIQDIIDYVEMNETENPEGLKIRSIHQAIAEGIEWRERGIPEATAAGITEQITTRLQSALPPIKRKLT